MDKKALAVVSMLLLLVLVGVCYANPDWLYNGADWKYVTTITGGSSQTTDVLVPNQAHWRVTGNCTAGADSKFGLFYNGGGTMKEMSGGLQSVGFEEFSSGRGPESVHLEITTVNVYSYTLVVEYDAAAPNASTTAPPSPSPSPSPSPTLALSPSPTPNQIPSPSPSTASPSPSPSPPQPPTTSPSPNQTTKTQPSSGFLDTGLPLLYGYSIIAVVVIVAVAGYLMVYFRKHSN